MRAIAGSALDVDLSVMPLDDRFDDRQPQAAAGIGGGVAPPVKTVEDFGQVFGGDADPAVIDPQFSLIAVAPDADGDRPVFRREFDGVVE